VSSQIEIIDFLARILRKADDSPEMTIRDLLHAMTWLHWHDQCRHCRQVIVNFSGEDGFAKDPWYHSGGSRSCRSAMYDADPDDRDPEKLRVWAEADTRLMAAPVRERDYVSWPEEKVLNTRGCISVCHVCQVKTELLKGRSGNGWSWGAEKV